jgi:GntR family transcriptional regulator, transcriptional repressor for pyruvate dehydrogenase complex
MGSIETATLKPVSKTTLSEQIAMQLAAELRAKRWLPGEKLPSEAELCKVFSVGRSTLREALKSLAFIGLIRMRAGGGSYVADQPSNYANGSLLAKGVLTTEKDVSDLSEARIILEGEVAGLFAQRATEQDLAGVREIVREMRSAKAQEGTRFRDLDLAFHLAIAAGSKNQVLAEMLRHIREALQELITKSLLLPAGTDMAYQQHREIMEAFENHDATKARKAMRDHLRAFQRGYKVLFQMPR